MASDIFAPYEHGLSALLARIGQESPFTVEAGTLAFRLTENIRAVRLDGDSESRRAERMGILRQLDHLAHETTGSGFTELCGLNPVTNESPAEESTRGQSVKVGPISGDGNVVIAANSMTIDARNLPHQPNLNDK